MALSHLKVNELAAFQYGCSIACCKTLFQAPAGQRC